MKKLNTKPGSGQMLGSYLGSGRIWIPTRLSIFGSVSELDNRLDSVHQ